MRTKTLILLLLLWAVIAACQAAPKLSPEELRAKWGGPIVLTALNASTCSVMAQTAQKIQAEEIDGFTAFGELLAVGMMLGVVEESLPEAFAAEGLTEFRDQVQKDINALKAFVDPWVDKEITSADVLLTIDDTCGNLNNTFERVSKAASDEGLSGDDIAQILSEVATSMETFGE